MSRSINWRTRRFRVLEFQLKADTAARMFSQDERAHYAVFGHDRADCTEIHEKRKAEDTSLMGYLEAHEFFDGELAFADPWPCSKCIPTEKLPEFEPLKNAPPPKNEHRWMQPKAETPTTAPGMATEAQVRKLMALYRKQKPEATKEAIKAAEDRAKGMAFKQASATIAKLEKGEKPAEAHTSPVGATSGIRRGAKVRKGATEGRVIWTGTGKSGAFRYGVAFKNADGSEQKEFVEHGWEVVE